MSKTPQTASKKAGKIRIGIGGWTFAPWRGVFYPDGLPHAQELRYAAAHLTSIETSTRVVLLQHPRERDVAIGTARMASLCLPNAELHVGVRWDDSTALARACSDPERPAVLLYPGGGAIDVVASPPAGPVTLIVIDGTWSQAKTVVRDNARLRELPRYTFTPPVPSEYRIRKEPKATYVSTLEALVQYMHEQNFIAEPMPVENLFVPLPGAVGG